VYHVGHPDAFANPSPSRAYQKRVPTYSCTRPVQPERNQGPRKRSSPNRSTLVAATIGLGVSDIAALGAGASASACAGPCGMGPAYARGETLKSEAVSRVFADLAPLR